MLWIMGLLEEAKTLEVMVGSVTSPWVQEGAIGHVEEHQTVERANCQRTLHIAPARKSWKQGGQVDQHASTLKHDE